MMGEDFLVFRAQIADADNMYQRLAIKNPIARTWSRRCLHFQDVDNSARSEKVKRIL